MAHLGSDAPLRISQYANLGDLPAPLAALQGEEPLPPPDALDTRVARLEAHAVWVSARLAQLEYQQSRRWWQNVADTLRSWWAPLRGA